MAGAVVEQLVQNGWIVAGLVVMMATVAFGLAYLAAGKVRVSLASWRSMRAHARARAMAMQRAAAITPGQRFGSPGEQVHATSDVMKRFASVTPPMANSVRTGHSMQLAPQPPPAPSKGRFYDKMVAIMKVSDSLTVEQLAAAMGVDVAFAWQHVFTWADHFGFKVVDGRVIFKGTSIEKLAEELDQHFKEWESKEKNVLEKQGSS
ncbi:MAG: hypothetical protein Q6373_004125 [Candidatus Sigynarchaeota archaeon]